MRAIPSVSWISGPNFPVKVHPRLGEFSKLQDTKRMAPPTSELPMGHVDLLTDHVW